jgi:hypothetical protein
MSSSPEFITVVLLKKDAFSETQSGYLADDVGTRLVRRRLDRLPIWSRALGRYLAGREASALERLRDVRGVPQLVRWNEDELIRSWLEGIPLQQAGKIDRCWADDAHRLLREMHRKGITHNDLAKPQNWLVAPDGRAAVIDMQLAKVHRWRGWSFRIARYEDLRHLLKQKERYAPELLTPTARRLLGHRSWLSRVWRSTFKPVYNFTTRRVLCWSDNEGVDKNLASRTNAVRDAVFAEPGVRDVAIVAYPKAGGTGLYAFVESDGELALRSEGAPDLLQVVRQMPRSPQGNIRTDLLSLVAENRIVELEGILSHHPELAAIVRPIAKNRQNLTDRYIC